MKKMEANFMEYLKARREDLGQVYQLVQDTIDLSNTKPPLYLALVRQLEDDIKAGALKPGTKLPPQRELAAHEIVGFFSNLHSKETIAADIDSGYVRVLVSDNCLIGTGTFSYSCATNR